MPRPVANIVRACVCVTLRTELTTFGRAAAMLARGQGKSWTPTPVSGQDNSAVALDNLRIFIAGALVGIAGGAFVGAIQEAIP